MSRAAVALRQAAHLLGDDREAAAMFAGARGFHRRVERQQVGLERDVVDDADDLGDALRRAGDAGHRGGHVGDHAAAAGRDLGRFLGERRRAHGALGIALHGRVQLLDRGRGLLQVRRALAGAVRHLQVLVDDLAYAAQHRRQGERADPHRRSRWMPWRR